MITWPRIPISNLPAVPASIFHTFDFPFYYFNIRANAEERVANYLKKAK
ncbi:hypothetical protein [Anoxynatronum sibiricum]